MGDSDRDYIERDYRSRMGAQDLVQFTVGLGETDLCILAESELGEEALRTIRKARTTLEQWIEDSPAFLYSLEPVPCPIDAPRIIREMCRAAQAAGVGPMAAVAGSIAELVACELSKLSPNVIVENGGDIYIIGTRERSAAIFAGESPLSSRLALVIPAERQPLAVCTSSATVGPSRSFGHADAAVVCAKNGALADAVATATANRVTSPESLEAAVQAATGVRGVDYALAIMGDRMAAAGNLSLRRLG